MTMLYQKYKSE